MSQWEGRAAKCGLVSFFSKQFLKDAHYSSAYILGIRTETFGSTKLQRRLGNVFFLPCVTGSTEIGGNGTKMEGEDAHGETAAAFAMRFGDQGWLLCHGHNIY